MNRRKKILFICPYYVPHTGGLEKYVYNVAQGLSKNYGWDVVVVTSDKDVHQTEVSFENGIKVYRLSVLFTLSNTPINPQWFITLKNIIDNENPDLINAHAPVPFLPDIAALFSPKDKFILTYHDGTMIKDKSNFNLLIYIYEHFILKFTLRKAKLIICSSDFIRKGFLKRYQSKSVTINPGVDGVGKIGLNKTHKNIIFVASITKAQKHKGLDRLITALVEIKRIIPGVSLKVVGQGDAIQSYKELARQLGVDKNIYFTGPLYGEDLNRAFRKSDVFVLPTSKESFGMVIIEAMSQGTPVVATKVGGIPNIVTDGVDGFLVNLKNTRDLIDAILKVLTDNRLARSMGKNAQRTVKNKFLWTGKIKTTNDTFLKALN